MKDLQISLICNLNQARSKISEGFCARLFPEFNFRSFGINAVDGNPIPEISLNLMRRWQVPIDFAFSSSVNKNLQVIQQSDIIVAADEYVYQYLANIGISENKMFSATESKIAKMLHPVDPINLLETEFELEVAKFVLSCSQIVNRFTNYRVKTDVIIPVNQESYTQSLVRAKELTSVDGGKILNLFGYLNGKEKNQSNNLFSDFRNARDNHARIKMLEYHVSALNESLYFPELLETRNMLINAFEKESELQRRVVIIGPKLLESTELTAMSVLAASLATGRMYFIDVTEGSKFQHIDLPAKKGVHSGLG